MADRSFPGVTLHGELEEVFPNVFFVTGSVKMSPMPVRFSRNMTVVRQGESLTLVNSIRLDDAGLQALDALGNVEHVIRIAGFHGMDDAFYKDRYDAKIWSIGGFAYYAGFGGAKPDAKPYLEPDAALEPDGECPIAGATVFKFSTTPPEGIVILDREGGIAICGDSLQNWGRTNRFFNIPGKLMMRTMGFIKPHKIGPGWIRGAQPKPAEIKSILDLDFQHLLPAHGDKVIGEAKPKYRPAIEAFGS